MDYGAPGEELVTVTGTSGTTLTVTRGSDGTPATAHNTGAKVRHVSSARDFADSRSHENASTDVHGVAPGAAIVSTTGTQTLTNKTINGATFNNIGPLTTWTTFTPTLLGAGGAPVTGTPTTNVGRYIKVGRMATVQMEVVGAASMVVPGGSGQTITFNVPATLAPRNPANSSTVMQMGTWTCFVGFGLLEGFMTYANGSLGFIARQFENVGTYDGALMTSPVPISMNLTYETAT